MHKSQQFNFSACRPLERRSCRPLHTKSHNDRPTNSLRIGTARTASVQRSTHTTNASVPATSSGNDTHRLLGSPIHNL